MIADNIKKIQEQISQAAQRCGRLPSDIKLVAVSKRFPSEAINEAVRAGQYLFGENYIQEVQAKKDQVPASAQFHFIGHLQSNKAKIAAACCDMIETVDSLKLGRELNKHLVKTGKIMPVLVQVNIGSDPRKSGLEEEETHQLIEDLNNLSNIKVKGLMTIPPFSDIPEESRPYFRNLKRLSEELTNLGAFKDTDTPEISMGMSGDFTIAIEEGATIIRVGTAIFGDRH